MEPAKWGKLSRDHFKYFFIFFSKKYIFLIVKVQEGKKIYEITFLILNMIFRKLYRQEKWDVQNV